MLALITLNRLITNTGQITTLGCQVVMNPLSWFNLFCLVMKKNYAVVMRMIGNIRFSFA